MTYVGVKCWQSLKVLTEKLHSLKKTPISEVLLQEANDVFTDLLSKWDDVN